MTSIQFDHIAKAFGETPALQDIHFQIEPGELLFLLGPSGCGKSTLLRILAGLLPPSSGRILFDEKDVTSLSTEKRSAVMCFQNYALWPHLTVRQNVAFGLDVRAEPKAKIAARVDEMMRLTQIDGYADRPPGTLSGGQQQRVALARALAVKPKCLLLDEPLSNLDAKLRIQMRGEIRRICKQSGFTTVYVTHDQKEALSVADRIVVLKYGKVMQIGTPSQLYFQPSSSFVADFVGQTNLIPGRVINRFPDAVQVKTALGTITADTENPPPSETVLLSLRPEHFRVVPPDMPAATHGNTITARVIESTFLGDTSEHVLEANGQKLQIACSPPLRGVAPELKVEIDPSYCVVLTS
jgi:iron(III) transport system ATP-binding protein